MFSVAVQFILKDSIPYCEVPWYNLRKEVQKLLWLFGSESLCSPFLKILILLSYFLYIIFHIGVGYFFVTQCSGIITYKTYYVHLFPTSLFSTETTQDYIVVTRDLRLGKQLESLVWF